MSKLENPAGRLYRILSRYDDDPDRAIIDAWAYALEIEPGDVHLHIGDVGNLLRDVKRAATESQDEAWEPMQDHLTTLSACIFPVTVTFNQPAREIRPDHGAMNMLRGFSSFLDARGEVDGVIPDDDKLSDLQEQVRALIAEITDADLPPHIRRALLDRLADMLEALEHVAVGGPDGIRRAAEALTLATVMLEEDLKGYQRFFRQTLAVGKAAIVAVGVVGATSGSLLELDRVIDIPMIEQGNTLAQLPPGNPSADATPPTKP